MVAPACRKRVYEALAATPGSSAEEIWGDVGWWTPLTIAEALDELANEGIAKRRGYAEGGGIVIRYTIRNGEEAA